MAVSGDEDGGGWDSDAVGLRREDCCSVFLG
jgi:hypothetical protein